MTNTAEFHDIALAFKTGDQNDARKAFWEGEYSFHDFFAACIEQKWLTVGELKEFFNPADKSIKFNDALRGVLVDHLQRGGNIRVFARGRYQNVSEMSFDGCGAVILHVDEVQEPLEFEQEIAAHAANELAAGG